MQPPAKRVAHQASPFEKEFGSSLFGPVHVLRLRERLRPRPVLALQTLKKAPGGGCQFRRESFVIILASERKFSREDAALLSLRPQDQCHRAGRRRAAAASIREMEHWSFEDAFKDF